MARHEQSKQLRGPCISRLKQVLGTRTDRMRCTIHMTRQDTSGARRACGQRAGGGARARARAPGPAPGGSRSRCRRRAAGAPGRPRRPRAPLPRRRRRRRARRSRRPPPAPGPPGAAARPWPASRAPRGRRRPCCARGPESALCRQGLGQHDCLGQRPQHRAAVAGHAARGRARESVLLEGPGPARLPRPAPLRGAAPQHSSTSQAPALHQVLAPRRACLHGLQS